MTDLSDRFEKRVLGVLLVLAIIAALISLSGWITHIVICIRDGQWLLLIAGMIAFPVGVIHGIGHWFGFW